MRWLLVIPRVMGVVLCSTSRERCLIVGTRWGTPLSLRWKVGA
jgi:hypothetical protein